MRAECFSEDFLPNTGTGILNERSTFIFYQNNNSRFSTNQFRIFRDTPNGRVLAGAMRFQLVNTEKYAGGKRETFESKTLSISENGFFNNINLYLFDERGGESFINLINYIPNDDPRSYSLVLDPINRFTKLSDIAPVVEYTAVGGDVYFEDISDHRIKGTFDIDFSNSVSTQIQNIDGNFNLRHKDPGANNREERFVPAEDDIAQGGPSACSNLDYNGPQEGQFKQWCQYAQFLQCQGLTEEKNAMCKVIRDFNSNCPYC